MWYEPYIKKSRRAAPSGSEIRADRGVLRAEARRTPKKYFNKNNAS